MSKRRYVVIKNQVAEICERDKFGYYHYITMGAIGEVNWSEIEYITDPTKVIKLPKGVK